MYLVLHGSCHPKNFHSHHIQTSLHANESENINVRAAIVHVIGDLLQSIGVFISSIIIKFYVSNISLSLLPKKKESD